MKWLLVGLMLFPLGSWKDGARSVEVVQEYVTEVACQQALKRKEVEHSAPAVVFLGLVDWVNRDGSPRHTLSDAVFMVGGFNYRGTWFERRGDVLGLMRHLRTSLTKAHEIMSEVEAARPPASVENGDIPMEKKLREVLVREGFYKRWQAEMYQPYFTGRCIGID